MLIRIAKEFRWEMGHRLPYHREGCQNLHGHSYRAEIELLGEPDEGGMVVDFGEISRLVKPLIDRMDHSFMVHEDDATVRAFLEVQGLKATVAPFHSTAENIAAWLLAELRPALEGPRIREIAVRVHETAKSVAEARWSR
jgi:6-pyruvoyltetrahydropterin/6-carboxytetrahydropterin synthase